MLKKSFLSIFTVIIAVCLFTFIACKKCDDLPAPTVSISNITSTSAKATWNKIEGADAYQVVLSNSSLSDNAVISTNEVNATEFTFSSLTPNKGLQVKVTPRCKNGKLATNTGTSATFVTSDPCNLPATTVLDVSTLTATTAKVGWEPVQGANGYQVQVLDLTTKLVKTINVQGPPLTLDSLVAGRNYRITVAAKCSNGAVSTNRRSTDYEHFIIIDDVVVMLGKLADSLCIKDGVAPGAITSISMPSVGTAYSKAFTLTNSVTISGMPAIGGSYHLKVVKVGDPTQFTDFKFAYGIFSPDGVTKIFPYATQCTGQKYIAPKQDQNFPNVFHGQHNVIYTLFADRIEVECPLFPATLYVE